MAKKQLGQNFLFDPSILGRIVSASGISDEDTVLEVGPGHGKLTGLLIDKAKRVIAIEIDSYFARMLKERYREYGKVEIIEGDALKFPYESLGLFKIVSNIPYYITTPLIFRFLKERENLLSMTLTIQKEVAQRIAAAPDCKDYGALSVAVQYYGNPSVEFIIPKEAFSPVPKVDSAVIRIDILRSPKVAPGDEGLFFKIVRGSFLQRRKTLVNSLKSLFPDIKEVLQEAGIEGNRRAETLSIEEFASISRTIKKRAP